MNVSQYMHVQDHLSSEGVFLMGDAQLAGFPIRYASLGFEQLYGYYAADIVGKKCGDLIGGPHILNNMEALASAANIAGRSLEDTAAAVRFFNAKAGEACRIMMANPGKRVGVALLANRKKSGEIFVCECIVLNLRHPSLNWSYCLGFQRDITKDVPLQLLFAAASEQEYGRLLKSRSPSLESRRSVLLGVGSENVVRYLHEKALDVFSLDIWRTLRCDLGLSPEVTAQRPDIYEAPAAPLPPRSPSAASLMNGASVSLQGSVGPAVAAAPCQEPAPAPFATGPSAAPPPPSAAAPPVSVAPPAAVPVSGAPPAAAAHAATPMLLGNTMQQGPGFAAPGHPTVPGAYAMQPLQKAGAQPGQACPGQAAVPGAGGAMVHPAYAQAAAAQLAAQQAKMFRPGGAPNLGDQGQNNGCWDLMETSPVVQFLKGCGLVRYAQPLLCSGFDDMETLVQIADSDMRLIGIPPGHAVKLRKSLRDFQCIQIFTIGTCHWGGA